MEGKLMIDGTELAFAKEEEITIARLAEKAGIYIPQLCNCEELKVKGNCRVCVVELKEEGKEQGRLVPACATLACDGMVVKTDTSLVQKNRRTIVELLLANHNRNCPACQRNHDCQLQRIADELNIVEDDFAEVFQQTAPVIFPGVMSIRRDRCIRCGRCKALCNDVLKIGAIGQFSRGWDTYYEICGEKEAAGQRQTKHGSLVSCGEKGGNLCILCGKCAEICPVGCLSRDTQLDRFWQVIDQREAETVCIFFDRDLQSLKAMLEKETGRKFEELCDFLKRTGVSRILEIEEKAEEREPELMAKIRSCGGGGQRRVCSLLGITRDIGYKRWAEEEESSLQAILIPQDVKLLLEQTMWV